MKAKQNERVREGPMKDLFLSILHNSVYTLGIQLTLMGSFVLGELGKCTKLHRLEPQSTELISDPFLN